MQSRMNVAIMKYDESEIFRSSLEFQYEKIADEIKRRRLEVESMTKEFEAKIKLKEVGIYLHLI